MGARLRLAWVDARGGLKAVEVSAKVRIGRAPECELLLDEDGVSRIHCEVKPCSEGLELADLRSTNGTFVNGTRVQEATLRAGDRVTVGRRLLCVEDAAAATAALPHERTTLAPGGEVEVALDAGAAYPPASLSLESQRRHLESLYGILRTIGEAPSVPEMFGGILRTILDTLPFDSGHVLIGALRAPELIGARDGGAEPELVAIASHAKVGRAPPASRTVVRRVVKTGQAVLANDVLADAGLAAAKSIAAARTLRIACAPIPLRGRAGVLYVAASGLAAPVGAEDVAFLNAAARQIGLAADALTERELLVRENELLKRGAPSHQLVGSSETMRKLREMVERAAAVEATVLITGESGTGKELVARGVHDASPRAGKPFVALNCGVLPGNVVQSELFGHEKGAFTGATARRRGLVELAHGGTLFLDEIGELVPEIQVMLLRLLEEKRFFRVGGQEEVRADVRFVAATNRDLEAACRQGSFRSDLLFRLKVVEIRTPALREHAEDLEEIARFVSDELARSTGRSRRALGESALERLRRHSWPGNVRELRNTLERALLLSRGPQIEADDLGLIETAGPSVGSSSPAAGAPRLVKLDEVEREHIRHVLAATGWNKTKAAEILGMARITLYEKIRAFDLQP